MPKHRKGDNVKIEKMNGRAVVFKDGHTAAECPVNQLNDLTPGFAKCDHEIPTGPATGKEG